MDKRLKNRFDVAVVFPTRAFSEKSRGDVPLTPLDVAEHLEEFAARVRAMIAEESARKERR